jgi:hypothetical protein
VPAATSGDVLGRTHGMKPTRSGYADVNGSRLYHEIYGEE